MLLASGVRALLRDLSAPALLAELPALPDLSGANPTMVAQIRGADADARVRVHSPERLGTLAMTYHANLFYDEAVACYEVAQRMDRRDHQWPHYWGLIHETRGETQEALPLLERALELSNAQPAVRRRLGTVALRSGDLARSRTAFDGLVGTETHHQHGLLGPAQVAQREGRWEEVLEILEPAATEEPGFGPARHVLASAYGALGQTDRAGRSCRRARSPRHRCRSVTRSSRRWTGCRPRRAIR